MISNYVIQQQEQDIAFLLFDKYHMLYPNSKDFPPKPFFHSDPNYFLITTLLLLLLLFGSLLSSLFRFSFFDFLQDLFRFLIRFFGGFEI